MRKNVIIFLAVSAVAGLTTSGTAATVSVTSLPQGVVSLTAPKATTSYLSLPLSSNILYSGIVGSVGTSSISVTNTINPFKSSLATDGAPYFVKFLSGNEKGRLLLITANTQDSLTLDITDDSSQSVSLLTSGFNVQVGDAFEIFAGDTLASIFGAGTTQNPLTLVGASSFASADWVNVFNAATGAWQSYYFSTTYGYWVLEGTTTNANGSVLYPYHGLSITRHSAAEADATFLLTGRVAEVPVLTKTPGSNSIVYGSTGYAVKMTLAQLSFGSNWITGTSTATADVLSVWNDTTKTFVNYYQMPDSTWRQSGNTTTNQGSVVIPPGTCIGIEQHQSVSGSASYLPSAMPYPQSNF